MTVERLDELLERGEATLAASHREAGDELELFRSLKLRHGELTQQVGQVEQAMLDVIQRRAGRRPAEQSSFNVTRYSLLWELLGVLRDCGAVTMEALTRGMVEAVSRTPEAYRVHLPPEAASRHCRRAAKRLMLNGHVVQRGDVYLITEAGRVAREYPLPPRSYRPEPVKYVGKRPRATLREAVLAVLQDGPANTRAIRESVLARFQVTTNHGHQDFYRTLCEMLSRGLLFKSGELYRLPEPAAGPEPKTHSRMAATMPEPSGNGART